MYSYEHQAAISRKKTPDSKTVFFAIRVVSHYKSPFYKSRSISYGGILFRVFSIVSLPCPVMRVSMKGRASSSFVRKDRLIRQTVHVDVTYFKECSRSIHCKGNNAWKKLLYSLKFYRNHVHAFYKFIELSNQLLTLISLGSILYRVEFIYKGRESVSLDKKRTMRLALE